MGAPVRSDNQLRLPTCSSWAWVATTFVIFGFHLPKVTGERPSHLRRTGVDCNSVVKHRREQFPEQQRDGIGQHPVQKQNGQLAVQQIKPLVVGPGENARPLRPSLDARPQDERQPDEESQRVAGPERT